MMYQGDFKPLHDLYRNWRQRHVPFPANRERKYFDDLRQLQMNVPIFDDVIIFQLDQHPIINRADKKQWKLHVKHDENWKVFGAVNLLVRCCQEYQQLNKQLGIQNKKNEYKENEEKLDIGLQTRCDALSTRIQYLFNFIMNYRSRYAHQIKNKENRFLLEEHSQSYQQLCEKLKQAKAVMDEMGIAP